MPSDSFARSALGLCGLAARALGWRPNEFWDATPAELATIILTDGANADGMAGDTINRADITRLLEQENDRGSH
ncbi:MAG: phage tail assembly chaperone [Caenibius sp.]